MFDRFRVQRICNRKITIAWKMSESVWKKSKCVYTGPVGPDAQKRFEFRLLEGLIEKFDANVEQLFLQRVGSSVATISAYCILGLFVMKSEGLVQATHSASTRTENVEWQIGYSKSKCTLGEFARMFSADHCTF